MVRIAVPTDLKGNANQIIELAFLLAKEQEAQVTFIRVSKKKDEERQASFRSKILEVYRSKSFELLYEPKFYFGTGDKVEVISNYVNQEAFDFVMLDGCSGIGKMKIFGSILYDLLKHINVPMLFLPDEFEVKLPSELMFASDLKDGDVQRVFHFYKAMSQINPLIKMVHFSHDKDVVTDQKMLDLYKEDIQSRFPYIRIEVVTRFIRKGESLLDLIQQEEKDWTSLSTHSRTFAEKFLNPSLTLELLKDFKRPLFVFKDQMEAQPMED